jgi:hypothetical protein
MRRAITAALLPLAFASALRAQKTEPRPIEVSGFFVEEAYTQERGMLQQIGTFTRLHGSDGWKAEYEQEWPLGSERHELDLSLPVSREAGQTQLDAVDVAYRYALVGTPDADLAVTPTLEAEVPVRAGNPTQWELTVPVSVQLGGNLSSHTNIGAEYEAGSSRPTARLGQSIFWRATPMLNLVLESVWSEGETVLGDIPLSGARRTILAPGVQHAFDVGRVQIVPGIAVPFTPADTHYRAVHVYFSVEHPFSHSAEK